MRVLQDTAKEFGPTTTIQIHQKVINTTNFKVPAYILGTGVNALGLIRNLGRNGVPVYSLVEKPGQRICSRYCKKSFVIPDMHNTASLKTFFLNAQRQNGGGVIFSASDLYSLKLSELKPGLQNSYFLPISSYGVVEQLVNKKKFYKSIAEFGIPYPRTYFPETIEDAKEISKIIKYPAFVKPVYSQDFAFKFGKKGFVVKTPDDLVKKYVLSINSCIDVLFQEVISGFDAGNMYGIEGYLGKNSEPAVFFAYIRLRGSPPTFGNTSLRKSIPLKEINSQVEATSSFLKHIKYQGLMEAEWKRDPEDGQLKLLEINARQSMQNTLPSRCGVNLILLSYLDAIGKKIKGTYYYEEGIKWMDFWADLVSARKTRTGLVTWIRSMENTREWSIFAPDDSVPWIVNAYKTSLNKVKETLFP